MKSYIIFLFIIFNLSVLNAQINKLGIPFTKYYPAKEYDAHPSNWAVTQDSRGVMYFGNNENGVLEYDGSTWRHIEVPHHLIVRSLAADEKGTVYVGMIGEFGMLAPDKNGSLRYMSLSAYADTSNAKNIWKTIVNRDTVFFCSQKKIFKYTIKKQIEIFPLTKTSFWSFVAGDILYVGNYNKGLMHISRGYPAAVEGGDAFMEKSITAIHEYEKGKILIGTMESGAFTFDIVKKISNPVNYLDSKYSIYNSAKLDSSKIVLATLNEGVLITNQNSITEKLTRKMGIPFETVTDVFYNSKSKNYGGDLWMTFENGLAKAELNSPIRKFDSDFGLNGDINDIITFKNTLYVATSLGVYYLEYDKNNLPVFHQVSGLETTLSLEIFKTNKDSILLAGTNFGLYEISKNSFKIIKKSSENVFDIMVSQKEPGKVVLATVNGFFIMEFNSGRWNEVANKGALSQEIRHFTEDSDGNIWASTIFNGIFRINKDYSTKRYGENEGIPSVVDAKALMVDKDLLVLTSKGVLKYNKQTDRFENFKSFGKRYCSGDFGLLGLYKGYENQLWLCLYSGNKKWIETIHKKSDGSYITDSVPFKRFPPMATWVIHTEQQSGVSWLGTTEGLFSFDNKYKKNYNVKYHTLLRNVIVGEDSVIFNGTFYKKSEKTDGKFSFDTLMISTEQPEELKPVLAYKNNNLTFIYSAPFFESESSTIYSRFLEGNDEGWSKWTKETKAIYTNLLEGSYTFHVKAKNVYGIESIVASYSFTVKPPWYRTWWAYVSYVVFLILLIWGIVSIATHRMKQLNIAYGRYLPGSFLKLLDKARVIDLRLGDLTEKEVTIMFSDIRSYTNLSESMNPHDNFRFLVSYLSKIGDMLHQNTGFPVQYYGDGIMAMFHGDTDNAVQAAIDMHGKVAEYSTDRIAKNRRPLQIGVGLHTGKIVMGIRGDARRWEGGIVGDSVNLAARMEGLTKMYGASTMMSDDTFTKLRNPQKFNIRFLGKVKVKGKDKPVGIYELLNGLDPVVFDKKMKSKTNFDAALEYYFEKDLEKSMELFQRVIDVNPDDIAALHYIELIKHYLAEGIPADWDGVEKLDKK